MTLIQGLTRQDTARGSCSLCRQDIPVNFLDNSQVINEALDDVDKDQSQDSAQQQEMIWFYEGRNGWWRFEERNSEELEVDTESLSLVEPLNMTKDQLLVEGCDESFLIELTKTKNFCE